MFIQKFSAVVLCILLSFSASFATNIPDPCMSAAYMPGVTNQTVSLFSVPNGQGLPLNQAQIHNDGTIIDATIFMEIYDLNGSPIPHYPHEDIWLGSVDGGMVPCMGGTTADFDTDMNGQTTWTYPLRAGGYSMSGCVVFISGMPLCQAPFNMYFNSADINGDGVVNLADLNLIAASYYYDFDYSVDFYPDGVLNLTDIGRFAGAIGASCH